MGLHDKALVAGERGYRAFLCEKLSEGSPMSGRASAKRLQDRHPAAGEGWAHQ